MANFVVVPATVVPSSSLADSQAALEWALAYAEREQAKQPADTYLSLVYTNLKHGGGGVVLSDAYAQLVKGAHGLPEPIHSYLSNYASVAEFNELGALLQEVANNAIDETRVNELIDAKLQGFQSTSSSTSEVQPIDYSALAMNMDYAQIVEASNSESVIQQGIEVFLGSSPSVSLAIESAAQLATQNVVDVDAINAQVVEQILAQINPDAIAAAVELRLYNDAKVTSGVDIDLDMMDDPAMNMPD